MPANQTAQTLSYAIEDVPSASKLYESEDATRPIVNVSRSTRLSAKQDFAYLSAAVLFARLHLAVSRCRRPLLSPRCSCGLTGPAALLQKLYYTTAAQLGWPAAPTQIL